MNIQPIALTRDFWDLNTFKTFKTDEYHTFDEFLHFFDKNPIKCLVLSFTHTGSTKTYIYGNFIGIEYEEKDNELLIYYVTDEELPHGLCQLCSVTYNGKTYIDPLELYQVYQNDKLEQEINEALV